MSIWNKIFGTKPKRKPDVGSISPQSQKDNQRIASQDDSNPIPWMENVAAFQESFESRGDSHPEVARFKASVCTVISQLGTNTPSSAIIFVDQYLAQLKQVNPTGYSRMMADIKAERNQKEHIMGIMKQYLTSGR